MQAAVGVFQSGNPQCVLYFTGTNMATERSSEDMSDRSPQTLNVTLLCTMQRITDVLRSRFVCLIMTPICMYDGVELHLQAFLISASNK